MYCQLMNYCGVPFKRVTARIARREYNSGATVVICPANTRPFSPQHFEAFMDRSQGDFDKFANEYTAMNCTCREVGLYPAYYLPISDIYNETVDYSYRRA